MNTIKPRKSLGQHFLHDENIVRKIVASLKADPADMVVEIGPGTGALTGLLLAQYPHFMAIEVDERAVAFLQEEYNGLAIRHQDVLTIDWSTVSREVARPLSIIGNLPYNITSQILFGLLDHHTYINRAVVMMQREVAERLVASPRTKAYGILSVVLQRKADVNILFRVSRNVFYPKPDVESAVVSLEFGKKEMAPIDEALYRSVVRMAFNQRRKTLRNSLRSWAERCGRPLPEAYSGLRAEALSPEDYETLISVMIRE